MPFRSYSGTSCEPPKSHIRQHTYLGSNRTKQIIKCLTRHKKPLEEADAWVQTLAKGPPQELSVISIHTARICAEAQLLFDSNTQSKQWESALLKIIEDTTAIDVQYQSWMEDYSITKIWGYQTYNLSPDESLPTNGMVQIYHDIWTAYIWTSCRSKCAHLHEVVLHCLSLLGCYPGAENISSKLKSLNLDENLLMRSRYIIEDMICGICATVPFMLSDVNQAGNYASEKKSMPLAGHLLLWPLHVARASTAKDSEREAWIRGRFEFIDRKLGIRYGQLLANKIKQEPWKLS